MLQVFHALVHEIADTLHHPTNGVMVIVPLLNPTYVKQAVSIFV